MKVIQPLQIVDAMIVSSTVTEASGFAAYSGATTYPRGRVIYDSATYISYRSLVDGNIGHAPALYPQYWQPLGYNQNSSWTSGTTYAAQTTAIFNHRIFLSQVAGNIGHQPGNVADGSTYWIDVGPSNYFACFDSLRNTPTVVANDAGFSTAVQYVLSPGVRVSSVALLGVLGDTIRVVMSYLNPDTTESLPVFDSGTVSMSLRDIETWFDYWFDPFAYKNAAIFDGLPQYTTCKIYVTITSFTSGLTQLGLLALGSSVDIGAIQYGADDDATNYSVIDRDVFGTATLVPRRSVPQTNQQLWAPASNVAALHELRAALNAIPCVWFALDDIANPYFSAFVINGIYRKFTINATYTNTAVLDLQLEEI